MKKLNNNNPGSVVRNLEPGKENRNDEAPIPPKRNYKNRMHPSESSPATSFDDQHITSPGAVAGSGFNVPRRLGSQSANNAEQKERPYKKKHSEVSQELYNPPMRSELREELLSLSPDVVIGEGVEIKGNFQFDGLLRLDGRFHGQFQTQDGDVIVGPTGVLISDLTNINRLLVEGGHVSGKLHVAHITICGNAVIKGDIVSKNLEILDADATIIGLATVNPTALDPPEPPSPAKPQEPVKVISYNKMKSAKSLFEKVTPEEAQELQKNGKKNNNSNPKDEGSEDLYEAKLEEKRKRKEAKKKEESESKPKESPREPQPEKGKEKDTDKKKEKELAKPKDVDSPKKAETNKEDKQQEALTKKEEPAVVVEEKKIELEEKVAESLQNDPVVPELQPTEIQSVKEATPVADEPKPEPEPQPSSAQPEPEPEPQPQPQPQPQAEAQPDPLPEPAPIEKEKDNSSIAEPQEVVLVSGALGSIPEIVIKQRNQEEPSTEKAENPKEEKKDEDGPSESSEPLPNENEMQTYGLAQGQPPAENEPPANE